MDDFALAKSADYADGLLTARKALNVLVMVILLMLLFQLALFFAARYKVLINHDSRSLDFVKYAVGFTDFMGVALPIVLGVVLLLIVLIMLQGRVLGVSRVVSAFVACVVLAVLLFPWQAFLMNQTFTSDQFKIPGVLYTWSELTLRARSHPDEPLLALLFWARFVAWPVVAIVLLLRIHYNSGKGLNAALRSATRTSIQTDEPPAVIS